MVKHEKLISLLEHTTAVRQQCVVSKEISLIMIITVWLYTVNSRIVTLNDLNI